MPRPHEPDFKLPEELQLPFNNYDAVPYDDELGCDLVRMLNLHPNVVRVRSDAHLAALSPDTKRLLLSDIRRALGVRQLLA